MGELMEKKPAELKLAPAALCPSSGRRGSQRYSKPEDLIERDCSTTFKRNSHLSQGQNQCRPERDNNAFIDKMSPIVTQ